MEGNNYVIYILTAATKNDVTQFHTTFFLNLWLGFCITLIIYSYVQTTQGPQSTAGRLPK